MGGDPAQHQIIDAALAQDELEIGGAERALSRLVDDRLAGTRRQLRNDLPAGLAAHEDAPARARTADLGADPRRAPALVGREIGEVRTVALAGVQDLVALAAHGGENPPDRLRPRPPQRRVVA